MTSGVRVGGHVRYDGPDRVLVLRPESGESVVWLRAVFAGLPATRTRTLTAEPGVAITGVERLELVLVDRRPSPHVSEVGRGEFVWSGTADEWETSALLLDPFLDDQPGGHQYLTNDINDDAVICVSFAESEPR